MVRVPTHRLPTHPGEMLLKEFIEPLAHIQQAILDIFYFL